MKKIIYLIVLLVPLGISQVFAQQDLTLEESVTLALENNTEIKNSKLETEAAQQIKKSAFTNYFPNISAGGMLMKADKPLMEMESEGGNLPVYDGDPANLGNATQFAFFPSSTMGLMEKATIGYVTAVQPLYAGGRIRNGNKLAILGEEVSEFKEQLTKDEIILKTEKHYWLIVSLQEKKKTIGKYEYLLNRLYSQVEDSYNSGVVMKNDVLKVKLKLSEVQLNKSKLNNGINIATMAFCQHIGIPFDLHLTLKDELIINELPQTLYVDNADALKKRHEYNLLELSVEAENLQTKMKLGEYLPEAGVGGAYLYMKLDDGDSRKIGELFGTVSIPISGWWGGSHELQERKVKEKIAENNFKNNSELLLLQMEKTWQDFNDAYKQYLLSEESKAQATENMKVNQDSYNNGLITVSDLLEAQALLQESEDQLTDAKVNYLTKRTEYLQVTGRN